MQSEDRRDWRGKYAGEGEIWSTLPRIKYPILSSYLAVFIN
jgi:hypothetical protein